MPSVLTDPQAVAAAIKRRQDLLRQAEQGGFLQPSAPVAAPVSPTMPQGQLDPAQAAAQGFRIPGGYIPPAQTAGGSGTYMSNVPNPQDMSAGGAIPPAQTAGGSGDYMSKVGGAQPSDPMTTSSVAHPENDMFSFFGKPQATDAMTAFGAAMLKGRTFADGLADASTAVNEVSKQYRPLSEPEINRMRQLAEIQRVLKGNSYSKGDVGYAPGIGYVPTRYNQNTGVTEYQIGDTFTSKAPPGFQQRTDYGAATNSKLDLQAYDKDYQNYEAGKANERQFADMVSLAPSINAGGDAWSKVQRKIGATLGVDFGGDLGDQQYFEKLSNSAQLEGAQSQKGLGQFTEMERKIVADSLPSMGTKESTIIQVGTRLALQQEIKTKIVEGWDSMSDQQKQEYGSYRTYKQRMLKDFYDNYEANYKRKLSELAPGAKSSPSTSIKAGQVEDGYRFKGGDPADKNNWEKVN